MITILKLVPRVRHQKMVLVKCVCGKEYVIRHADAIRAKSCGCLRSQGSKGVNLKHGLREHELYGVHRQMIQRCYNKEHESYHDYGGRGVTVFSNWHDVATFIDDIESSIGKRPYKATLDRKDNNGNYEPDNVKWSTRVEQCRNRRNNLLIEIDGIIKCPSEWAEYSGISRSTIVTRYRVQGVRGIKLLAPVRKKN